MEIVFAKGRLEITLPPAFLRNQSADVRVYSEKPNGTMESIEFQGGWSWAFQRQAQAFVDCLLSDNANLASGQDSLEDLLIIEKIWELIVGATR